MSFQKNTGHYIQQNHDYILPNLLFIIQSILVWATDGVFK